MAPLLLQELLSKHFGEVKNLQVQRVGGGSINDTFRVCFSGNTIFCKINSATKFPHLFQKEKAGLQYLAAQQKIKTPEVLACEEMNGQQFLLLQWINEGERTEAFWKQFGRQLAALHQTSAAHFGLNEDNYMGSVLQQNTPHQDWCLFFAQERLAPMAERCASHHLLTSRYLQQLERLQTKLSFFFNPEAPALLHGDLWSGNFLCNAAGEPVLIDPAVYFGHRSVDLAMTTLFGGFHPLFYEAYHHHFPLPSNYKEQWEICNLYPLLIHLYLFGSSYLPQIQKTLDRFA